MTYVNPASCIAVSVLFIVLGALAIAGRYYVRLGMKKGGMGIDDWLCIPAWLLLVGCAIDVIIAVQRGAIGHHTDPTAAGTVETAQTHVLTSLWKFWYSFLILDAAALGCVKLSILFFYRRVFTGRVFNILSWTMIAIIAGWTIAFVFANIFPCGSHFADFWGTIQKTNNNCVQTRYLALSFAFSDTITDFLILCIPQYWIWKLQMPLRQKLSVFFIFMLGGLAVASSVCRAIVHGETTLRVYLSPGSILGVSSRDILGIISMATFWAMIELGVALTVSCLPSLRSLLFNKSVESLFGSIRSKSSSRSRFSTKGSSGSSSQDAEEKSAPFHRGSSGSYLTGRTAVSHAERENRKYGDHGYDYDEAEVPAGSIMVKKGVHQYFEQV